jgi:hypothetical protein
MSGDYPFFAAGSSAWYGKTFLMIKMSKLMIQSTNMVPTMPITANVQPNVQVSIAAPSKE